MLLFVIIIRTPGPPPPTVRSCLYYIYDILILHDTLELLVGTLLSISIQ